MHLAISTSISISFDSTLVEERITTECYWSLFLGRLCHLARLYYFWPSVTRNKYRNRETSIFALDLILFKYYRTIIKFHDRRNREICIKIVSEIKLNIIFSVHLCRIYDYDLMYVSWRSSYDDSACRSGTLVFNLLRIMK